MDNSQGNEGLRSWIFKSIQPNILNIIVPLAFLLLLLLLLPFRARFEFDPDEGINAMKALLLARGYPLYSEIWSDQPPLFTYMLAVWFRGFGFDINTGRTLVLLLSTALVGVAFYFLRTTWGVWHGLSVVFLILLLPYYKTLSVSVMIGLPALAFAGLSFLSIIIWHQRHQNLWLVLSALALGLSVLIKLFTGFLAAIFLVGILIDQKVNLCETFSWSRLIRPAFIWVLSFAVILLGLGILMIGPGNVWQLVYTHLDARQAEIYTSFTKTHTITWYLFESWAFLLLALVGTFYTFVLKKWVSLYLVAWALSAYVLLSFQVPVWYHHQTIITFPVAILAAIALGEAVQLPYQLYRTRKFFSLRTLLSITAILCTVLLLVIHIPQTYLDFTQPVHLLEREKMFLTRMTNHTPETDWVVTDSPMYAFYINVPVPPPLAALSEKRLVTGDLTEEQIIDIIAEYKPEQVLVARFKFPNIEQYLKEDHRLLYSRGKRYLYLRKDG